MKKKILGLVLVLIGVVGVVWSTGAKPPYPFIYNHGLDMSNTNLNNGSQVQANSFACIPTPGQTPVPGVSKSVTFLDTEATPVAKVMVIKGGIVTSITP